MIFIVVMSFIYVTLFQPNYDFVVKKTYNNDGMVIAESIYRCDKTTGSCKYALTH